MPKIAAVFLTNVRLLVRQDVFSLRSFPASNLSEVISHRYAPRNVSASDAPQLKADSHRLAAAAILVNIDRSYVSFLIPSGARLLVVCILKAHA